MKNIVLLISILFPTLAFCQPELITAKNINATQKIQLANKTATAISETVTVASTHAQLATSKSVWDLFSTLSATVTTDATLAGAGTVGSPLKIAPQSAGTGQVLKYNGSTWLPAADDNSGMTYTAGAGIGIVSGVISNTGDLSNTNEIELPSQTGNNGKVLSTNGTAPSWITANAGTVTSVGLSLPSSIFTPSGSPVTTSGTLTGTLATQTANTIFAGPTTGAAAAPTFRSLVAADVTAAGGITGTGTINYLPKFTAAATVGNSQIFDTGTKTGIGTATPAANLSLVFTGIGTVNERGFTMQDMSTLGTPTWRFLPGYGGQYDGWFHFRRDNTLCALIDDTGSFSFFQGMGLNENKIIRAIQHENSFLKFVNSAGTRWMEIQGWPDLNIRTYSGYENWFKESGFIGFGESAPAAKLEIKATGATSATFALRVKNSSNLYAFSVRNDRAVIFDNLTGTGNRLLQLDATGIATRSTLDPATLVTGNIYTADGTTSGNRTVTVGNNYLRLDASTATNAVSNPLVIKGKADGTNETQAITFQNAAGNPLSSVYVTNTGTKISAAAGSTMTIGAGTYGILYHENGYAKYPLLAVDPTVTNVHSALWFNSASSRYKYNKVSSGTTPRQIANTEDDIVGTSILTTSSTYTLTGVVFRVQADANLNAITITADGTMQEGYTYLVRCRRNGTNAITISAGAGYNLGVDGDSTLSPATYTCGAYEILKITRYDTVIFVDK